MNGCCIIVARAKLYQGIALYYSLLPNMKNYKVFFLCMDDEVYYILDKMNLNNAVLINVNKLEDETILKLKKERNRLEYCCTMKPVFLIYVLNNYPDVNIVTYMDADLYFFGESNKLYEEMGQSTVMLSNHDLPESLKYHESQMGKYNGGFVIFKRDSSSLECLNWWKQRCFERCSILPDGSTFVDQKYLELMYSLFNCVSVIETPGVNIAQWNVHKNKMRKNYGEILVNNDKLIFYHFSGLRILSKKEFVLLNGYDENIKIVAPIYSKKLSSIISRVEIIEPTFDGAYIEEHYKAELPKKQIENFSYTQYHNKFHLMTIVSSAYLFKAIVMHNSLEKTCRDFHHFILCIDDDVYKILSYLNWEYTTLIHLNEIEDDTLKRIKAQRMESEYCWTLKPFFTLYIMDNFPETEYYIYVDSDLLFYSNIDEILLESSYAPIFLCHHNHSRRFISCYNCGIYNAGFIILKNIQETYHLATWWKDKCIEWCNIWVDESNKRFADQRYLEQWDKFVDIHVIDNLGVNTSVWNIDNYKVYQIDNVKYINDNKLIFYHYSSFSIFSAREFNLSGFYILKEKVVNLLYVQYMVLLFETIEKVQTAFPDFNKGFTKRGQVQEMNYYHL